MRLTFAFAAAVVAVVAEDDRLPLRSGYCLRRSSPNSDDGRPDRLDLPRCLGGPECLDVAVDPDRIDEMTGAAEELTMVGLWRQAAEVSRVQALRVGYHRHSEKTRDESEV